MLELSTGQIRVPELISPGSGANTTLSDDDIYLPVSHDHTITSRRISVAAPGGDPNKISLNLGGELNVKDVF